MVVVWVRLVGVLPSENHRICDICALELVETQHTRALCDGSCHERQRIKVVAVLHLDNVHALVHILHEVVEVDAGLGLDVGWEGLVEQVHEHGLAASYVAVHVQSLGEGFGDCKFLLCVAIEQRAEERLGLGVEGFDAWLDDRRGVVGSQSFIQVLQLLDDLCSL